MQKNEAFTAIPNTFLEGLYSCELSKTELTIALAIARHTFGYRQSTWHTTNSYIAHITNLQAATISRGLQSLAGRSIIEKSSSETYRIALSFRPVSEWR